MRRARYARILPAGVLNAVGTLLQLAALLFIPAAVLAGLRGAFIAGTAMASAHLRLRDAPVGFREWGAVGAAACGAFAVGAAAAGAAALYPEEPAADSDGGGAAADARGMLLGIALSLAGYLVASAQVVFEQLSLDVEGFSRWEVLGVEGVVGCGLTGAVLIALAHAPRDFSTLLDDPAHTACCLTRSAVPTLLAGAYGVTSLAFNALLLVVASAHGPNARVFVFVVRGVLTWVVEICLAYAGAPGNVGRGSKVTPFAALEAVGWISLVIGGIARTSLQRAREAALEEQKDALLGNIN